MFAGETEIGGGEIGPTSHSRSRREPVQCEPVRLVGLSSSCALQQVARLRKSGIHPGNAVFAVDPPSVHTTLYTMDLSSILTTGDEPEGLPGLLEGDNLMEDALFARELAQFQADSTPFDISSQ